MLEILRRRDGLGGCGRARSLKRLTSFDEDMPYPTAIRAPKRRYAKIQFPRFLKPMEELLEASVGKKCWRIPNVLLAFKEALRTYASFAQMVQRLRNAMRLDRIHDFLGLGRFDQGE